LDKVKVKAAVDIDTRCNEESASSDTKIKASGRNQYLIDLNCSIGYGDGVAVASIDGSPSRRREAKVTEKVVVAWRLEENTNGIVAMSKKFEIVLGWSRQGRRRRIGPERSRPRRSNPERPGTGTDSSAILTRASLASARLNSTAMLWISPRSRV